MSAEKRRSTLAEAMEVVIRIVGALVAVHQLGIGHRDIKPENTFILDAAFGQRIPKLLDFGIAKVHDEEHMLTKTGSVMGTLGHMSPEQLQGAREVDRRADVWSIGIVLYELLAGAHPFDADNYAAAMYKIMHRQARALYDIVPRCPKGISDIVRRTLHKNRQDGPDSMLGLLEVLLRWSREETDETFTQGSRGCSRAWRRWLTLRTGVCVLPDTVIWRRSCWPWTATPRPRDTPARCGARCDTSAASPCTRHARPRVARGGSHGWVAGDGDAQLTGGVAQDEPRVRLTYAMSLDAMGHRERAREAFAKARDRLMNRAERISDPSWRKSFLEQVREHQQTLALAQERCDSHLGDSLN